LLPQSIKQTIIDNVSAILKDLPVDSTALNNQKDPNRIDISIRNECEGIIKLAQMPEPANVNELRKLCASKLAQWDEMKQTNIALYSQELYDFLKEYGYNV
jgi:hypothetical protein